MSMLDVDTSSTNRLTTSTIRGGEPASPRGMCVPSFPRTPDYSNATSTSAGSSQRRCYCGNPIRTRTGMYYCSPDCARGDAFSSLTHTRSASSVSTLGDAFDDRTSRTSSAAYGDDDGSFYRRMKRDERREQERRQRAVRYSLSPESIRSPSAVPELVSSHSRNTSTASSTLSFGSSCSLSRHPSSASHTPFTASVVIDDAIMEDDELAEAVPSAVSTLRGEARRRLTEESKRQTPLVVAGGKVFGTNMAVDDMLDEIINMEESFRVPDDPIEEVSRYRRAQYTPDREHFVPTAYRPPRTPSPTLRRRKSVIPPAPNAPDRRNSLSQHRPPSMYAHTSSLSESHTALYLATASPVAPSHKPRHRRSASPKLSVRRSITFSPQTAGPALPRAPRSRIDSPGLTPVRRKHLTPTAHHPPMEGWRFPTASSNDTPTNTRYTAPIHEVPDLYVPSSTAQEGADAAPQLLWPQATRNGDMTTAQRLERTVGHYSPDDELFQPPSSSLRLGMLMNSDSDDMDSDDASTVRGSIRGSIRDSFLAPIPPFTQRGW
ncbi:hypothetical protein CcaverHIS002_0510070 [Cutaneotrichosporon cavernicola]|uniref:Uncharacterized protein n=1 Tax=Cutaneotrichosporon cavernicola TaxID=279322 RepID=A0AA48QXK2_9TREE|nr:uncharacterized protein CcaverHIS019_0510630 [Cutaneotrichosporon cavernicola]BEI85606.1 hypothetical protein CcaverHIS002_0510070 [Cutaneotrichosporon cavernicola]BEI93435.1 hypothetical protein CcaverHIS019_0510630 [Cutaneotrichosporon cavernicola]BEJ08981.1 hypothetical protein CcaverHIS641_0510750 [Cutaneotrichosporon cavernicola]